MDNMTTISTRELEILRAKADAFDTIEDIRSLKENVAYYQARVREKKKELAEVVEKARTLSND